MALVLLCGHPASGKSAVATSLHASLTAEGQACVVVADEGTRAELFADAGAERTQRSRLRARAERALTPGVVVVVDSLNYIKGFRYEMYCVAKTAALGYCVVHCDGGGIAADAGREDAFGETLCRALVGRFEAPVEGNRWDSPLFRANVGEGACDDTVDSICQYVRTGAALAPTAATRAAGRQGPDVLGDLDRFTREAEAAVVAELQAGCGVGSKIRVPGGARAVCVARRCRVAELRGMRRAYLGLARMHPPKDASRGTMVDEYVDYVNAQLRLKR